MDKKGISEKSTTKRADSLHRVYHITLLIGAVCTIIMVALLLQKSELEINKIDELRLQLAERPNHVCSSNHEESRNVEEPQQNHGNQDEAELISLANKYHIVLLSYHIKEKILSGQEYAKEIAALKEFLDSKYEQELGILEQYKDNKLLTNNQLSEMLYQNLNMSEEQNLTHFEKLKNSISNLISIKKIGSNEVKFREIVFKDAIEYLKKDLDILASEKLSEISDEQAKVVLEELKIRSAIQKALNNIIKGTLK
jgi:hypothetical protein